MNNNYLKKKKVTCEEEDFAIEYVAFLFLFLFLNLNLNFMGIMLLLLFFF